MSRLRDLNKVPRSRSSALQPPMQSYDGTDSPLHICRCLEQWSTWTRHDIESDKAIVDTVNALIAVVRVLLFFIPKPTTKTPFSQLSSPAFNPK